MRRKDLEAENRDLLKRKRAIKSKDLREVNLYFSLLIFLFLNIEIKNHKVLGNKKHINFICKYPNAIFCTKRNTNIKVTY